MTAVAPAAPRLVLADRVFPRTWVLDIVLVVAGAALVSLLAQVTVQLPYVPITGQTLAVLLVGSTLGARRGAAALGLYALLGIAGLPVFAPNEDGGHDAGFGVIFGASGGYILGFIVAAALVGWLSERAWDRKVLKALATFAAGTLVVFIPGLFQLAVYFSGLGLFTGLNGWESTNLVLSNGLYPFLISGAIKAIIAAGLLPLAWWGAGRLDKHRAADAEAD